MSNDRKKLDDLKKLIFDKGSDDPLTEKEQEIFEEGLKFSDEVGAKMKTETFEEKNLNDLKCAHEKRILWKEFERKVLSHDKDVVEFKRLANLKMRRMYLVVFAIAALTAVTIFLVTKNKTGLHNAPFTSVTWDSFQKLHDNSQFTELNRVNTPKPIVAEQTSNKIDSTESTVNKRSNDIFVFNKRDLRSIIIELSKWYNVPAVFKGNISKHKYFGTFSKAEKLEDILSFLQQQTKVKISIENNQIVVRP